MLRPLVLALLATLPPSLPPAAAPAAPPAVYAVDVPRAGAAALETLESGARWWAELGDMLVLETDGPAPEGARRIELRPGERLFVGPRLHPNELGDHGHEGVRLLATSGVYSLLAAAPGADEYVRGHGGERALEPLEPDTVYARAAANRPGFAPAAKRDSAVAGDVDAERWLATVRDLQNFRTRFTGTRGMQSARDYIAEKLEGLGLDVEVRPYLFQGLSGDNVIGEIRGTTRPDEVYVVSAHYDSISEEPASLAPGAEDNGSGTAGVLELARIFAERPPAATIRFALFSGEEQGLYGSYAYVEELAAAGELARVKGSINMDMIGYTADADLDVFLDTRAEGAELAATLERAAAAAPGLRLVRSSTFVGRSDHVPFISRHVPAVLAIENDFGEYPGYHRTTDTVGNLRRDMGGGIMRMVGAALEELAGPIGAPPAARVAFPNGGETLQGGLFYTLAWQAPERSQVAAYTVEYSADGGATFDVVASGLDPAVTSYEWQVPAGASAEAAVLRVTAHLDGGLALADVSDAAFRVIPGAARSIDRVKYRRANGGELVLTGSLPWEASAVEVDGARLGATIFRPRDQDGDTARRVVARDGALASRVPKGVAVSVRVVDVRTGGRTAPVEFTR